MRSDHQCRELEVGRKTDRYLAGPISAYRHPERSEQRERRRRTSDSFALAKPVPVLWVGLLYGCHFFSEFLTQHTSGTEQQRLASCVEKSAHSRNELVDRQRSGAG